MIDERGRVRVMVADPTPALLITAPDHVPVRLLLPHRGAVDLALAPSVADSECVASLDAPNDLRLKTIEGDIIATSVPLRFKSAMVVRDGTGQGAWLLRCPSPPENDIELRKYAPSRRVDLTVAGPIGADISIDGELQGAAPLTRSVRSGFVKVQAGSVKGVLQRWVPALTDLTIELPDPTPSAGAVD
ncbi:MAG: hypothetical protein HC923_07985 [Myxococcales bacterium]|nr:hypothetical protein [Myxococcales bacterium]